MRRAVSPVRCAVVAVAMITVVLAGCVSGEVAPLPDVPDVPTPPTSTLYPDFSSASIPTVEGEPEDPTVDVKGGNSRIFGRATSEGAPMGGAIVKLDRFVGARFGSMDVTANEAGEFSADGLQGGRYRVRAYRAPDAAMVEAQVFFLGGGEQRTTDLQLERFGGAIDMRASVSPDPPILGQPATMVLSFSTRGVDPGGTAKSVGVPNLPIRLVAAGGRQLTSPNPATTDASGRVTFTFRCGALENQGLSAILPDGSSYNVNVSECRVPPTTTTTAPPPPSSVPAPPPPA